MTVINVVKAYNIHNGELKCNSYDGCFPYITERVNNMQNNIG